MFTATKSNSLSKIAILLFILMAMSTIGCQPQTKQKWQRLLISSEGLEQIDKQKALKKKRQHESEVGAMDKLKKLKELKDAGILSEKEYNEKRKEYLKEL